MDATAAQTISAYGSIIGAIGGVTAAVFGALTCWRGRHRSAPHLRLVVPEHSWTGFSFERDSYGSDMNTLPAVTITNIGDATAHAVSISAVGAVPYSRGDRVPDPIALIEPGDSVGFTLVCEEDPRKASVQATWGQSPNVSKRRGPQVWALGDHAPDGWEPV